MAEAPPPSQFSRSLQAGDVLFREGELGDEMFVIQSGAVRISKRVGDKQKTLADLGPGEFVGEMAILNGKARTATATATVASQCLVVSSKTLETMVARNGEIAIRLIKKLAARLDQADALIEILLHKDPRARVILGLSRYAGLRSDGPDEGLAAVVELTVDELADRVGVDANVADEVVARLRRIGLVYNDPGGGLGIPDLARLHEFFEFLDMASARAKEPG